MTTSLRGKLVLWFALFSFALAAVSTIAMYISLGRELGAEDENILAARVHGLRLFLTATPSAVPDSAALAHELEWKSTVPGAVVSYARVTDLDGHVLGESRGMAELLPATSVPDLAKTAVTGQRSFVDLASTSGEPFRVEVARIDSVSPGVGPWIVEVALSQVEQVRLLQTYRRKAAAILFAGLFVAIAAGWMLVHRGFRPVQDMVATSRRIRSSTLDERMHADELPMELKELALTLNQVLDRLEDSFSRLSRFSADIAHELRTPLNNLRGETEVALGKARTPEEYREILGSNLEEYDRLARLIESLLFLARAEDPKFQVKRENFDATQELEELFDFYEGLASDAGVALKLDAKPGLRGHLEKTLFLRAVGNLVLNGIRYTGRGGTVTAHAREQGEHLVVEVEDTGCGIAREHIPRLFERFFRVDPSRTSASGGTGLGLSIVKTIAEVHEGQVEIESEPGKGTRVRLSFHNRAPSPREA